MKLLVLEALAAGLTRADPSVAVEGLSMLRRLVGDLSRIGWIEVSTLIDSKLKTLPFDKLLRCHVSYLDNPSLPLVTAEAGKFDKVYVIAPETGGLLPRILSTLKEAYGSSILMNGDPEAASTLSDKLAAQRRLREAGIETPRTVEFNSSELEEVKEIGFPLVIKPRRDTGCSNLYLVESADSLQRIASKLEAWGSYIAQRYVRGVDCSLSLLSDGLTVELLSVNRQFIRISSSASSYLGGYTPLTHVNFKPGELAAKLSKVAEGLKGYVGVDLVASQDRVYALEVNPRLTVSYVGLSRCLEVNPAGLIAEASLEGRLRTGLGFKGVSVYLKVRGLPIRNPFLEGVEAYLDGYSLISGLGLTLNDAWLDLSRVRGMAGVDSHPKLRCRRSEY